MADKTPIRGAYSGASLTGLAEYATGDTIGISFGGTGLATVGNNQLLTGNGTSALTSESSLTFDGTTLATTAFTATGNVSLDGGTFVFNESGADKDFRVEGDSEANLLMIDASTDRIGIGTATPSHLVDIEGVGHAATCFVSADLCATTKVVSPALCIGSQYALPAADGSAGQIMCTDGSGAIVFATASAGVTLAGSTNNTIATVTGSNALAGEANLTFDGSNLLIARDDTAVTQALEIKQSGTGDPAILFHLTGVQGWYAGIDNSASDLFYINTGSGNTGNGINITTAGKVGIGTAAPNFAIDVAAGASQVVGQFWGTTGSNLLMVGVESETLNEHAGIVFQATQGTTVGSSHSIAGTSGLITNDGGVLTGNMLFYTNSGDSYAERMRIDSAGNVGIGASAPTTALDVQKGAAKLRVAHNATYSTLFGYDGLINIIDDTDTNDFRVAFDDSVKFMIEADTGKISQTKSADGDAFLLTANSGSAPYGFHVFFSGASPDNNGSYFFFGRDSSAQRIFIYSDGDLQNHDNSYGGISDAKLKTDILDARNYWDDFKQIQFRKFKFLSDIEQYGDDADSRFGVIAQEIETIFPSLIKECPDFEDREIDTGEVDENGDAIMKEERIDLGTTTKGVKYSVLSQIGLKVVQELQTRLEAAEARIAALESA